MKELKRWLCRLLHGGLHLKVSVLGHGAVTCSKCGASFVDLTDAGALCLDRLEAELSTTWRAALAAQMRESEPAVFVAQKFVVRKKDGRVWRVVSHGRVA